MPVGRLQEVVIDCAEPQRLAEFWQQVVGGAIRVESGEWITVVATGAATSVSFQRVPEAKAGKNRVHLDVRVDDLEVAARAVEALGGGRHGRPQLDPLGGFQVMRDPEGNEFCLVEGDTPVTV